MRRGNNPQLYFTKSGNLVGLGTGSDACTEHECGAKPLISTLCDLFDNEREIVKQLKDLRKNSLSGALKRIAGHEVEYPQTLESRRVTKANKKVWLVLKDEGECEAILYCAHYEVNFDHHELQYSRTFSRDMRSDERPDVAAAWDEESFAIRVRGKKNVKAILGFHQAILDGHVAFGGTFFKRTPWAGGVVLVDTRYLSDDDKQELEKAQKEYESGLRLKAADDTPKLREEMANASGNNSIPGYIWVRWADENESEVVYCLNPGYGVKANYLGPYTRQQLLDWAKSGYSYHLTNAA